MHYSIQITTRRCSSTAYEAIVSRGPKWTRRCAAGPTAEKAYEALKDRIECIRPDRTYTFSHERVEEPVVADATHALVESDRAAFKAEHDAFLRDETADTNPHREYTAQWFAWISGFNSADAEVQS